MIGLHNRDQLLTTLWMKGLVLQNKKNCFLMITCVCYMLKRSYNDRTELSYNSLYRRHPFPSFSHYVLRFVLSIHVMPSPSVVLNSLSSLCVSVVLIWSLLLRLSLSALSSWLLTVHAWPPLHTHTYTCARTHTHVHVRTHTHTHTNTHTHTHTHTELAFSCAHR